MSWWDPQEYDARRADCGLNWGFEFSTVESTPSTNDLALEAISAGAPEGAVWVAREQTRGRGRRGNVWTASPGDCLTLSVLLKHRGEPERMMGLSLVVGLAVRQAVQQRLSGAISAQIKWPNDVMVNGKKLAGILIETRSAPDGSLGVVVGVGLNVHTQQFPTELPDATSLALLGVPTEKLGFEALTVDFLAALEEKATAFFAQDFSPFRAELVGVDYLHNRRVRIGNVEGRGSGFDEVGRLLVADQEGQLCPVISGQVELLD